MLPSVFTVTWESNERIRSVSAAAGAIASKARKQAVRKFFMEVSLTIALLLADKEGQNVFDQNSLTGAA
jgi:hypothetical protein